MFRRSIRRAMQAAPTLLLAACAVAAQGAQRQTLSEAEWDRVGERVALLDRIAHIPSLLPVIMKNRYALRLSDEQVASFRAWRRAHYDDMTGLMNQIIERRIALSRAALDPAVDGARLLADQAVILQMQQELLRLRLSCRELMVSTFSAEQWSDFAFVLEEYPGLAGLITQ